MIESVDPQDVAVKRKVNATEKNMHSQYSLRGRRLQTLADVAVFSRVG